MNCVHCCRFGKIREGKKIKISTNIELCTRKLIIKREYAIALILLQKPKLQTLFDCWLLIYSNEEKEKKEVVNSAVTAGMFRFRVISCPMLSNIFRRKKKNNNRGTILLINTCVSFLHRSEKKPQHYLDYTSLFKLEPKELLIIIIICQAVSSF